MRALVVWGGERGFAAGADVKVMADLDSESVRPAPSPRSATPSRSNRSVPMINHLRRILAATRSAAGWSSRSPRTSASRQGRAPGPAGELSNRRVPRGRWNAAPPAARRHCPRARPLVISNARLDPEEALDAGLVDRVLPPEEVYPAALESARGYADGPGSRVRGREGVAARRRDQSSAWVRSDRARRFTRAVWIFPTTGRGCALSSRSAKRGWERAGEGARAAIN